MGVLGLWQLLSPVGQPVTLESLENKTLAVDISIWLNQAIKGYRDSTGGAVGNAHLLSLFSRLCKLLYYKIRPIIVFDGGVPELKKQTVINRQQRRNTLKQSSQDAGLRALTNYMAAQGFDTEKASTSFKNVPVLSTKAAVKDDIFILPPLQKNSDDQDDSSEPESFVKHEALTKEDLRYLTQIDIESDDFQALPPEVKQEILSTLIETRKHRHWSYYENLPEESGEFSNYQMQCLLKKRKIQSKLEAVHQDIQKKHCTDIVSLYGDNEMYGEPSKVMSDDVSHYVYLKKVSTSKSAIIENIKEDNDKKNNDANETPKSKIDDEIFLNESTSSDEPDDPSSDFHKDIASDFHKDIVNDETLKTSSIKADDIMEVSCKMKVNNHQLIEKTETDRESKEVQTQPSEIIYSSTFKEIRGVETEKKDSDPLKETSFTLIPKHASESELIMPKESEAISNQEIIEFESSDDGSLQSVPEMETDVIFSDFLEPKEVGSKSTDETDILNKSFTEVVDSEQDEKLQTKTTNAVDDSSKNIDSEAKQSSAVKENVVTNKTTKTDSKKLAELRANIQKELQEASVLLQAEHAKQQRQASTVQEHMVQECKDLLKLFGVPYIVSPMEAEAQCAFYDLQELTHGTITDDSDIWLFGGKRVYKNFFAQQKYVEFFQEKEILSHFNLDRRKLICFAMLTGSDYTEGIENVGPVTAMEVLSEFTGDGIESLSNFKQWWEMSNKCASPPKNKVRAKLRKLSITGSFPNQVIFETYLNPEVDNSIESFSWGLPDLDAIRDFAKEKFGWNKDKVDGTLLPVIKRLNERMAQTHLDSFFTMHLRKEKNLFPSKRITSALKKMSPSKNNDDNSEKSNTSKRNTSRTNSSKRTKSATQQKKTSKKVVSKNIKKSKVTETVQLSEESSCDDPTD